MLDALNDLPDTYVERLANVDFAVSRAPNRLERRQLRLRGGSLYGLYAGVPLSHRDSGYHGSMPDRITLYWGPLIRDFPDDGTLAEEVRKTVYHEIGHHFGLNEDDLHDTSVR